MTFLRDSILELEKDARNLKEKHLLCLIYVFPLCTIFTLLIDVLPQTVWEYKYLCFNDIELVFFLDFRRKMAE